MVVPYTAKGDCFGPGRPHVWSEMHSPGLGSIPTYDLAPDGKRFAVVRNPDGTEGEKPITSVTVLLNFFDELRRRVPARGK
jgi:serine/threonine-protein kinase